MKRPLLALALLPLGLWAAFVLPDLLAAHPGFWDWRRAIVLLTGVIALWWMSAGIVLASRPGWLEQRLGGLDKLYRLHRNIGIGAGMLVFSHWMSEWLPKNLARLGWLPERVRGHRGPKEWWIDLAKDVGEWAGYILLALVVIALLRRIPYRWFRFVHKAFGLVFAAGVFHGLLMMPKDFWLQPLGWLTTALACVGLVPAALSLSNRIGRQRKHTARVEGIRQHADQILEITCRPEAGWPGHRAGQFLFADFGQPGEGAHPFTIASAWQPRQGTLTLAIKTLGDFTAQLPALLRPGQGVVLEGPYGRFDFATREQVDRDTASPHQVWIAGGIGVTPFLAQLEQRAQNAGTACAADFFYCTPEEGDYPGRLEALCHSAGVRLHRRLTAHAGPLPTAEIEACLQPGSSVWFCGPAGWGQSLARSLTEHGLPPAAFHREAFEFR